MPCVVDRLVVGTKYDRRVKVTPEIREQIIKDAASGEKGAALARKYGVSKKTVYLILNPAARERARAYTSENWKRFALDREQRAEAMRKHRAYKQKLLDDGMLAVS